MDGDVLTDPERALAVAYAPAVARAGLTTLFALDERLGGIVATTTEPMIGLMRLAWWREALEKLDHAPPPAEPLLTQAAATILPKNVSGAALAAIEDGWAALLDGDPDAAAIARHGRERGGALFGCAWRLLESAADAETTARIERCGQGWALADLAHRHSGMAVRIEARRQATSVLTALDGPRWPRRARPLAALAALARRDVADDAPRRQGGPARLLRMLALHLTGR